MGIFAKDITSMDQLFLHTLRDVFYAENQIIKALPKMIEKASDSMLKQGFQIHLEETRGQIRRLEQVFKIIGAEDQGLKCPAINGIIEEAEEVSGEITNKAVLDAALIAAAQTVEHYEIARYGTLIAWANQLGRRDCASLLQEILDEEKATNIKLTSMAETYVNRKAA